MSPDHKNLSIRKSVTTQAEIRYFFTVKSVKKFSSKYYYTWARGI